MKIRKYHPSDLETIKKLFFVTVRSISNKDYTLEELEAWAPEHFVGGRWETLEKNIAYVVVIEDEIVGFGDLTKDGHLDRLYVHKDHQRKGIGAAILKKLEAEAKTLGHIKILTESSITAKPFFEAQGFVIIRSQDKVRYGQTLLVFQMFKKIS